MVWQVWRMGGSGVNVAALGQTMCVGRSVGKEDDDRTSEQMKEDPAWEDSSWIGSNSWWKLWSGGQNIAPFPACVCSRSWANVRRTGYGEPSTCVLPTSHSNCWGFGRGKDAPGVLLGEKEIKSQHKSSLQHIQMRRWKDGGCMINNHPTSKRLPEGCIRRMR